MRAIVPDCPREASSQGALQIDRGEHSGTEVELKSYFRVEGLGMLAKKGA